MWDRFLEIDIVKLQILTRSYCVPSYKCEILFSTVEDKCNDE